MRGPLEPRGRRKSRRVGIVGIDPDSPSHRVAARAGGLWPARDLDAGQVPVRPPGDVIGIGKRSGHAIDQDRDTGLSADGIGLAKARAPVDTANRRRVDARLGKHIRDRPDDRLDIAMPGPPGRLAVNHGHAGGRFRDGAADLFPRHPDRLQWQGAAGGAEQHRVRVAKSKIQPGAGQQQGQPRARVIIPPQPAAGLAPGQFGIRRKHNPGLGREFGERGRKRAGGHIILLDRRLRACRRSGEHEQNRQNGKAFL